MNKITFDKPRTIVLEPETTKTTVIPAKTKTLKEVDWSLMKWIDDPTKQTVTAWYSSMPHVLIMGSTSKTNYDVNWSEESARQAFLVQTGLNDELTNEQTV